MSLGSLEKQLKEFLKNLKKIWFIILILMDIPINSVYSSPFLLNSIFKELIELLTLVFGASS
jgi:hypothetical protein